MTKLARATEIAKASATKQEAIEKIMNEMGVTKANAFVYFTKIQKILGDSAPASVRVRKEAVATPQEPVATVEPVKTEGDVLTMTPAKKAKKVKKIDTMIAAVAAGNDPDPLATLRMLAATPTETEAPVADEPVAA